MNLNFVGDVERLLPGIRELENELGFTVMQDGMPVAVEWAPGQLEVSLENGRGNIRYAAKHQFFRGLGLFIQHAATGNPFFIRERQRIDTIGPMFDLSRNGVLTVDSFKFLLRKMALMGFNSVMLYMEDTYEIDGEPYFGYMRGRYSHAELQEIDGYADQFGIEAFPSIQTLAHLEEFLKWDSAVHYRDTRGVLLVDYEPTYELVEKMIAAATAPFRSDKIHIGMDEAEELGRGRFLDRYGYKSRFAIMTDHLRKVLDIVRKNGLKPMMWSDMFLKLASASGEDYYGADVEIPDEMANAIPSDVLMVYWDYFHTKVEDYVALINKHRKLGGTPAFAGGIWIWNCFTPNYGWSLKTSDAALKACKQEGVKEVYCTLWGDDGMENNPFNALLGLQLYAEHAYADEVNQAKLYERAKFCTGIDAEAFVTLKYLDETPGSVPDNTEQSNPAKFLLWQDVLLGLFDRQIEGLGLSGHYAKLEQAIKSKRNPDAALDYLFEVPERLCGLLKQKSELGIEIKRAYDGKDLPLLKQIALELLPRLSAEVEQLRLAHRRQWFRMFKPFGWEVLDIRYGGVVARLESAAARLLDFAEGRIARIEELEQERLIFSSQNRFNNKGTGWCSYYYRIASPNVFFHVLPIF
ncbi:MAG TPA: beta-N-acetylhexosaminidase [Bacilli bacterium]